MTSTGTSGGAFTASHIPPERWKNSSLHPNEKSDVYSYAILLWELLTNEQPYAKNLLGDLDILYHAIFLCILGLCNLFVTSSITF